MTDEQANDITREQAIRILHPDTRVEAIDDYEEAGNYEYAYDMAILMAIAALRQGWVRTAERVPEGDEHDEILGLYKGPDYLLYDIVQVGWLRLHPEMYPYWTRLLDKPEVEG